MGVKGVLGMISAKDKSDNKRQTKERNHPQVEQCFPLPLKEQYPPEHVKIKCEMLFLCDL